MKNVRISLIVLALTLLVSATAYSQSDSISDLEGNVYKTVSIGTQWWMAENLKVTQFSNGDPIPHLTNATEWANTEEGAYCYYGNRTNFADSYGLLRRRALQFRHGSDETTIRRGYRSVSGCSADCRLR